MISTALDYARTLRELNIASDIVGQADDIFKAVPQVKMEFEDPSVALHAKHNVIDKIFPVQIRDFLKILCDNSHIYLWEDILSAYKDLSPEKKGEFRVILSYVTPPDEEQLKNIRDFLIRKYQREDLIFETREEPSLGGGFVIQAGNEVYDWSVNGRMKQFEEKLEQISQRGDVSQRGIISILRSEIEDFELEAKDKEIGCVSWVGDGIANVNGIDHAMYGEIVIFDCGVKGMVQDIRRDEIGCILFGHDTQIREGTRVVRTGKRAGIPVGEAFKGRIIDALGAPVDGAGPIKEEEYRPIEEAAPSIVDRKSVGVPMETGILAIDSMFPIGRGQRELIIGDRQTGKTSIALDTILNQKGKDVICIYVAIGQKASTIAKLVGTLKKHDAMEYTIIVSATASDPAPLQYIAPYSGTALAEYFMYQGKDVLIIYDDLSKHAVAYRALSLLLERSPGREAYPGDVFYLHSRLLERSARLSDEKGGGSITALPIIETQAGDVSAYIPTNVISITDGQIFLESDLFFSGMRPAVNVGLSVSRVGGAAQTKAMKKAAGSIRIDLAQFREMEVFTQFASDLDSATKEQLQHGRVLMELLKQPLGRPLSMAEQVITLCAANSKVMLDLPVDQVKDFQMKLLAFMAESHSEIIRQLESAKTLDEELEAQIVAAAGEFKKQYQEK
ncbi:MAG TPA: F0F1 ATP synthase subunit alpha [Candidatus Acetatifactor stercoripullorum]|uniref:Multifunctional fusion protein n=1 Tax=Candidatus Acetatifactor stercoripullorum TaxID=2838414 RepID=A0A9D1UAX2_9FIRM|nr:F0F1 ATP synthase subunit alpha [uncultured Acetatifactor sp.]HIW81164.1 F0F1 ATP synthase subunit alpha [Candidatus Acetatifactor stercoripullorum]